MQVAGSSVCFKGGGVAGNDPVIRDVFPNHGASAHHRPSADANAGENDGVRRDPRVIANMYRAFFMSPKRVGQSMRCRDEFDAAIDRHEVPNLYRIVQE